MRCMDRTAALMTSLKVKSFSETQRCSKVRALLGRVLHYKDGIKARCKHMRECCVIHVLITKLPGVLYDHELIIVNQDKRWILRASQRRQLSDMT